MNIGKYDIRYDNITYWPFSIKIVIWFIIIILLLINLYFLFIRSSLKDLSKTIEQEIYLRTLLIETLHKTKSLPIYQQQVKDLKKVSMPLIRKLYNNNETPKTINIITQLLKVSGLKLRLLHPEQLKDKRFYVTMPLKIQVSGQFKEIITFMSQLIKNKVMFNYQRFNLYKPLNKRKTKKLIFDANLNIYLKNNINNEQS